MRLAYIQDYITSEIRTVFVPDHLHPELNAFEALLKITSTVGTKEYEKEVREMNDMKKKKKDTIEPKPYMVFGSTEFEQSFNNAVYGVKSSLEEPDNLFSDEDKFKPLPKDVFEKVNPCKKYDEEYEQFMSSIRRLKKNNESKKAPIVEDFLPSKVEELEKASLNKNFEKVAFTELGTSYPKMEKTVDWSNKILWGNTGDYNLDEEIK